MRFPHSRRTRSGVAATELAVLLPFLMLAFAAALDFGRIYQVTQTLQEAATVGASYATGVTQSTSEQTLNEAGLKAACTIGANLPTPLTSSHVSITTNSATGTKTVRIEYEFYFLNPILGSSVTLTRTSTMVIHPVAGS